MLGPAAAAAGPLGGALGAIVGSIVDQVGVSGEITLPGGPLGIISEVTVAVEAAKEELCPDSSTKVVGGSKTVDPCGLITNFLDLLEDPKAALEKFPRYEIQRCYEIR